MVFLAFFLVFLLDVGHFQTLGENWAFLITLTHRREVREVKMNNILQLSAKMLRRIPSDDQKQKKKERQRLFQCECNYLCIDKFWNQDKQTTHRMFDHIFGQLRWPDVWSDFWPGSWPVLSDQKMQCRVRGGIIIRKLAKKEGAHFLKGVERENVRKSTEKTATATERREIKGLTFLVLNFHFFFVPVLLGQKIYTVYNYTATGKGYPPITLLYVRPTRKITIAHPEMFFMAPVATSRLLVHPMGLGLHLTGGPTRLSAGRPGWEAMGAVIAKSNERRPGNAPEGTMLKS